MLLINIAVDFLDYGLDEFGRVMLLQGLRLALELGCNLSPCDKHQDGGGMDLQDLYSSRRIYSL